MIAVPTYRGACEPGELGVTLMHEHVFVRDPELELSLPESEWDAAGAIERAVRDLTAIHALGVRTIVDLTVPGLGRDVHTVALVAGRVPVRIVASTGWYTRNALPLHFQLRGPGLPIDGPDELTELFIRDIEDGIGGSTVRAGMLKVTMDAAGLTEDIARIMRAAAIAQQHTGVTITTHSNPGRRNGLEQQRFLRECGVSLDRVIIGHSGDTDDVAYLRALMDAGSTIGMDRFGMEHVLSDERRTATLLELLRLGYADRMVLGHDAAAYSHVTPPSWRALHAPGWTWEDIPRRILPRLRQGGASDAELDQMLVANPRRLLEPAVGRSGEEEEDT